MRTAWLAALLSLGPSVVWADTPERCIRLSEQSATPLRTLPARERRATRVALGLARMVALQEGSFAKPFLTRLPFPDASSAHLIAYVPAAPGGQPVLVYYSTALREGRVSVGASPFVVVGIQEPRSEDGTEVDGFYLRFPKAYGAQALVSETVTRRGEAPATRTVTITAEVSPLRVPDGCH